MLNTRAVLTLTASAILAASCAHYTPGSASDENITKADAAKTVVLHVQNLNSSPMELRTILNGQSLFVGSVSGQDSTNILLDARMFPTGNLFLTAIPSDRRGAARVGPLVAGRGDIIKFTIQPALDLSRAIVVR